MSKDNEEHIKGLQEDADPKYAYDGYAACDFAINGQPVEFKDMINVGLAARVQNSIDSKREAVAIGLFGQPSDPVEVPVAPNSEEDEVKQPQGSAEEE